MRTVSTTLRNYLAAGRNGWLADLWTFALPSGTTLRWTNSDVPLAWGGQTYAVGPGLERSRLTWRLGLSGGEDSDALRVQVMPRAADLIGSTPLATALQQGDFDGAVVMLQRAYGATPGVIVDVLGGFFTGRVGPVEVDDFAFSITVYAPTYDLDMAFPKNVVQAQCGNRLYDEVCGLDATSYRTIGGVAGGVNATRTQFSTGLSEASGHFALGRFKWWTGENAGRSQSVRAHSTLSGVLTFAAPWPGEIAVGDVFEVYAGCDKRQTTCSSKFSNVIRFRGMPFVPSPETTT